MSSTPTLKPRSKEPEGDRSAELESILQNAKGIEINSSEFPDIQEFVRVSPAGKGSIDDMATSINSAQVAIISYRDSNDELFEVPVVWKKLMPEGGGILRENMAYNQLQKNPEVPTLRRAFSAISENDERVFATVAEPHLLSLESAAAIARAEYLSSVENYKEEAQEALYQAYTTFVTAATLALLRLHQCNIEHRDVAPKNFGILESGVSIAYDFELANVGFTKVPKGLEEIHEMETIADKLRYEIMGLKKEEEYTADEKEAAQKLKQVKQTILERVTDLIENYSDFSIYGWSSRKEEIAIEVLAGYSPSGRSRINRVLDEE
jgi:tRNA A-37 threonylcarbamoyl transferase component Bud32